MCRIFSIPDLWPDWSFPAKRGVQKVFKSWTGQRNIEVGTLGERDYLQLYASEACANSAGPGEEERLCAPRPMPWSEEGSVGRNLNLFLADYNFLLFQIQLALADTGLSGVGFVHVKAWNQSLEIKSNVRYIPGNFNSFLLSTLFHMGTLHMKRYLVLITSFNRCWCFVYNGNPAVKCNQLTNANLTKSRLIFRPFSIRIWRAKIVNCDFLRLVTSRFTDWEQGRMTTSSW